MLTDGTRSLRDKKYASTTSGLRSYQGTPFLNRRKNQEIAVPHQLRHVIPVTQDLDAGVRKHRCQLCLVGRQEFSGDLKSSIFRGGRPEPRFKGVVYALSHGAYSHE